LDLKTPTQRSEKKVCFDIMPRKKPTERGGGVMSRAVRAVQTQAMKMVGSQSPKGRVRRSLSILFLSNFARLHIPCDLK
jgi:hypothetical protein